MDKKIIKFDYTEIEKYKFHQHKRPILISNIGINEILVKSIVNILLAIKDDKKLDLYTYSFQKWVHIEEILIKLNECFFFIKDEILLEKLNKIWKKVSNIIEKEFDSKPVYNENYLKTNIKSYNGKINNFHNQSKIFTMMKY